MVRATLREVAERAGVSIKTVTNVMHQRPNVRASTRERVQAAIDELDYHPNLSARNLALGRAGTIALVVPQLDMPYFASLAMHVLDVADSRGWFVLIVQTRGDVAAERRILSGAFPQRLDGVIFDPLHVSADEIRDRSDTTPLVLIGEGPHRGIADHVGIDNTAASRVAVDHLAETGRTRLAMIGASQEGPSTDRGDGFLDGVRAHGLSVSPGWVRPVRSNTGEQGAAAMAALLDDAGAGQLPDGLFCATDWLALGAIRELTTRGIRVPEDIAVVGFDDIPYGRVSTPTLTTIASARDEIARAAVESLERQQTTTVGPPREIQAGFQLVVRESTG
ncbi:LacI family DNA-binding transcriptional regulator [Pseudactinotalea suaedae]|uniref:LacI family DNA-binding transcriptional regulator n=1 Tax=Pseudactinotalea suaedae TaxID=1524924 RepID=UPI0019D55AA3|nr:LacI family DNA-binding transcriptional regulator [Pseudactinotalea suaedae]